MAAIERAGDFQSGKKKNSGECQKDYVQHLKGFKWKKTSMSAVPLQESERGPLSQRYRGSS